MKISLFLFSISFFLVGALNAQNTRVFDPTNARDGESVEYCHQHIKMKELKKDLNFKALNAEAQAEFEEKLKETTPKGVVYKIPVVFHVLHNEGVEDISDEQIYDALSVLNRDFRKQNADTANVNSDFEGMPADSEIEFVLATKAPNGECFKCITRTTSVVSLQGDDGQAQVQSAR